jgi:hypothetical protein
LDHHTPPLSASAPITAITPMEDNDIVKDKKEKKKDKNKDKNKDEKKKKDNKEKKKDKKKQLKGYKSTSLLGTPVIPTILNNKTTETNSSSLLSQDHLTIQNTIKNGGGGINENNIPTAINTLSLSSNTNSSSNNNSSDSEEDEELISPSRRKSVTFSNETAIGIAASEETKKKEKKKDKKNKKKENNNNNMASIKYNNSGYNNVTSHPYNTTHPIVKFRKMKLKHCQRLPEPPNDQFLKRVHDRLILASANNF